MKLSIVSAMETKPERMIILACAMLGMTMIILAFHMLDELDQIARAKRMVVYINRDKEKGGVVAPAPVEELSLGEV